MKKILYLCLLLVILVIPGQTYALNEVNVFFFHKTTCDICEQERIYLKALQERYPNMRIHYYEVSDENNFKIMEDTKKMFNETKSGVPFTVVADTPYIGFNQGMKGNIQRSVYLASTNKYENKLGNKLGISYRNDLEGTVVEYKENSDYVIEEKGEGKHPVYTTTTYKDKVNKSSIILIIAGLILLIVYLILTIIEKRRRNR